MQEIKYSVRWITLWDCTDQNGTRLYFWSYLNAFFKWQWKFLKEKKSCQILNCHLDWKPKWTELTPVYIHAWGRSIVLSRWKFTNHKGEKYHQKVIVWPLYWKCLGLEKMLYCPASQNFSSKALKVSLEWASLSLLFSPLWKCHLGRLKLNSYSNACVFSSLCSEL